MRRRPSFPLVAHCPPILPLIQHYAPSLRLYGNECHFKGCIDRPLRRGEEERRRGEQRRLTAVRGPHGTEVRLVPFPLRVPTDMPPSAHYPHGTADFAYDRV